MKFNRSSIILFLAFGVLHMITAESEEFYVWKNSEVGIRFTYPKNWKPSTAIADQTLFVINWTSRNSGGLMASCYIEANDSGIGHLTHSEIRNNAENIATAVLNNAKKRDPEAELRTYKSVLQDNVPAVYVERTFKITSIDGATIMRGYSIITAWKGKEIFFECVSDIPVRFEEYRKPVEDKIRRVLRSLQFDR